jgi:hypothetical protein
VDADGLVRRLLLGAVLLILACGGAATLPAPSQFSPTGTAAAMPTATIDVADMIGVFPAATFFVVTDDGIKAIALPNHATKYTIPTTGAVQVATVTAQSLVPGAGWVYVADEISDGTRLRWIDAASGAVLASWAEPSRRLVATGIGHGALAVEPTTGRVLALYADGERRVVEAYDPYSLRPLGKRFESSCGDRLLAGASRVVVPCFAAGEILISDNGGKAATVHLGVGAVVAAAIRSDGTTLVGRDDGTLERVAAGTFATERIEPFRPARLAPDGIASVDAQGFAIALLTTDIALGISELRSSSLRYISFPAGDRVREIPVGGLLAQGQFAFWSNGREARHIDLQQGFVETMATLSGMALPGGVGQ